MSVGVPARANLFLEPKVGDAVFATGGKFLQIPLQHHITENVNQGTPLVFKFPKIDKACFNLEETYIKFKLKIVNANGTDVAPRNFDAVYPANGIAHTMWKEIKLYANSVPISKSYAPYDLKKVIEHLLIDTAQNDFQDELWGWKKRVAPTGDLAVVGKTHVVPEIDRDTMKHAEHFVQDNPPLTAGYQEFMMKPCLDFFDTDSNVISLSNVDWELRMTPHENKHCLNWAVNHGTLQSPDETGVENSLKEDYKLQIEPASVKMFLRTEYYTEDAYVAAMEAGQQQGFKYNYTPTAIRTKTLSEGHTSIEMTNLAVRSNPLLIAHTFVDHEAHNGSKRRNPYLFRAPPNLQKMYNYKDGQLLQEQSPVDLMDPFGGGRKHLYMNNLQALGIKDYTAGLSYNYRELNNGFFFKIISLAPSGSSNELAPLTTHGQFDFRFELAGAADKNYETITYMRFEEEQIIIHLDGTVQDTFSG